MGPDDDKLMLRVAKRDEEALRLLVARWEQPVYAFLCRMLGSAEEARDQTQETFVKVFDQAPRYRPEGKFKSWLFRIAGNRARSVLRRRKILGWVRFDPAVHDRPAPGADPASDLEREETARRVREAIDRLPERQRQAVLLRRFHDLSYQEIAAAMDATLPAVESLLQRAVANLRRDLERETDAVIGGMKR